ncbi:MAG: hypothetical protein QW719_02845 [Candidatus Micrarchaeaceae archaeon]
MMKELQLQMRKHLGGHMKLQLGLGDLEGIAIIFVVLAVVLAVGAYILSTIGTTANFPANSVSATTLSNGQTALNTFATWLPILAIVIVAAIVIYILIGVFHGRGQGAA